MDNERGMFSSAGMGAAGIVIVIAMLLGGVYLLLLPNSPEEFFKDLDTDYFATADGKTGPTNFEKFGFTWTRRSRGIGQEPYFFGRPTNLADPIQSRPFYCLFKEGEKGIVYKIPVAVYLKNRGPDGSADVDEIEAMFRKAGSQVK